MIILKGIEKRFSSGAWGVRDIHLSISQGEAIAILGASGSGKTTLLDIIGTLSNPTAGTCTIAGCNVRDMGDASLSKLRRYVLGYIFQSFNLIHDWTVKQNLQLALKHHPHKTDQQLHDALAEIGLYDKLNSRVNTLSGGEQQRLAILRAVLRKPRIVLADEPTGNLDAANVTIVMDMLFALWRTGKTLVMITHSQELASLFPRTVRLEKGHMVEDLRSSCAGMPT